MTRLQPPWNNYYKRKAKQMFKFSMIFLMASVALATSAAQDAGSQHTEWLFVQNAQSVSLADGVLTLAGISPTTLFFSDRPERIAAHGLTSEFVTFWGQGGGWPGSTSAGPGSQERRADAVRKPSPVSPS